MQKLKPTSCLPSCLHSFCCCFLSKSQKLHAVPSEGFCQHFSMCSTGCSRLHRPAAEPRAAHESPGQAMGPPVPGEAMTLQLCRAQTHTRARPCAIRPAEPFLSCLPAGTLLLAAVPLGSPWGWKGARRCSRRQEMTQGCSEQAGKAWCNSTANGQAGSGCLTLAKCSAPSWQASPNLSPGSCRRGCCARRARLAARGVGSRARGQMGRL